MKELFVVNQSVNAELDFQGLKSMLSDYAQPRAKISRLLADKFIIRVKKGLYVLNPELTHRPYVKETLANLIYGPSAISLEYALSFYGLIPERVETLTSVTCQKNKSFDTPVGLFTYQFINPLRYSVGITHLLLDESHPILIATKEKALADTIILRLKKNLNTIENIESYLFEELRLNFSDFLKLNKNKMKELSEVYDNQNLRDITAYLRAKHE